MPELWASVAGSVKHRHYTIHVSGDDTIVSFLHKHVRLDEPDLRAARKKARAIELLFPAVRAIVVSRHVRQDAVRMKL